MGREFRATRQNETAQGFQILVHHVNFHLKPLDLSVRHPQGRVFGFGVLGPVGAAHVGTKVKEIILDAGKGLVHVACRLKARDTDKGVQLVRGAIGADPGRMFGHALPITQGGVALVTGAGVDLAQNNHIPQPPCERR